MPRLQTHGGQAPRDIVPRQQRVAALGAVHLPPTADVQQLTCQGARPVADLGKTRGKPWEEHGQTHMGVSENRLNP